MIGVTGSAGKTSTKDLIAHLLRPLGPTVAPPESFNNELGTPWTVLRATEDTRYLVLEMSARGVGHIAAAGRWTKPRIGAVLNVGRSHLAGFGSQEQIAVAKGELVEALSEDGVAVLNADDQLVSAMRSRTTARVVFFGQSSTAQVRAENVVLDETARASFDLVTPAGSTGVTLGLYGAHMVSNALAAAAIALELGADLDSVAKGLSSAVPVSRRRMEVTDPRRRRDRGQRLLQFQPRGHARGFEDLGHHGPLRPGTAHLGGARARWANSARTASPCTTRSVGWWCGWTSANSWWWGRPPGRSIRARAWRARGERSRSWCRTSTRPSRCCVIELRPGDVVLVKASKADRLWRVAEALLAPVGGVA